MLRSSRRTCRKIPNFRGVRVAFGPEKGPLSQFGTGGVGVVNRVRRRHSCLEKSEVVLEYGEGVKVSQDCLPVVL